MKITQPNLIVLIFTFIFGWSHISNSSVFEGTLVSTPKGLIPVEKLKIGDKVISCNTDGKLLEVPIKNIGAHSQGIVYRFFTEPFNKLEDAKYICSPAFQELYDPFLKQWIKAEKITTTNWLMTHELGVVPVEQIQCEQKKCREYHIELSKPHVFFISNCSYSPKIPQNLHQLILVHNFIPAGVAIPSVSGATLTSAPFAEAGVVLLKLAENAHPVVKTVAGLATAGAFLYKMFKPDDTRQESVKIQAPQDKIWVLNNMPQQEGGNQPSSSSNGSLLPQQPNNNNQNNK